MKTNRKIWLIAGIAALVLALVAVGIFGFLLPYVGAAGSFPQERLVVLQERADGRVDIFWPESPEADRYYLEVLIPGEETAEEFSAYVVGKTQHTLPPMAAKERTIRVRVAKEYKLLFDSEPRLRLSEDAIVLTDTFTAPAAPKVTWTPDPDKDTVAVALAMDAGCSARGFLLTQSVTEPIVTMTTPQTILSFGEGKQLPLPAHNQPYEFNFDAYREGEGFVFYGTRSETVKLTRDDLLGMYINLTAKKNDNNTCTLTWDEAKGDYYEIQTREDKNDRWESLSRIELGQTLTYTTEKLAPYSHREYRAVTYKNADAKGSDPLSKSDPALVETASALVYSTIWPIKDLPVFDSAAKVTQTGTAGKGDALCVLALENGMFRIRTGKDTYGYIDSNYCMINLPDFLGKLLAYNITNSYSSLFAFHGIEIADVTGETVVGYERVMLDDDTYLVPYLYPSALKLENAALAAKKEGYQLKIIDSFRPQEATQDMYSRMESLCPTAVPVPQAAEGEEPIAQEILAQYLKEDGTPKTYQEFITDNNRYKLNYFLAKGTSRHNRGAALDMTLVKNGQDQEMQTTIHDLTWYSETAQNTSAAKKLAKFMKGAGFGGLVSEWWHFQDDEALDKLDLPALKKGVTPEGWVADENGWRYRRADGNFYKSCQKTIDGQSYSFNSEGYTS